MSETLSHRGRVAALSRSRPADDPELLEARRNLTTAAIREYVQRAVDKAPPLTDEQKSSIAAALTPRPGGGAR